LDDIDGSPLYPSDVIVVSASCAESYNERKDEFAPFNAQKGLWNEETAREVGGRRVGEEGHDGKYNGGRGIFMALSHT